MQHYARLCFSLNFARRILGMWGRGIFVSENKLFAYFTMVNMRQECFASKAGPFKSGGKVLIVPELTLTNSKRG